VKSENMYAFPHEVGDPKRRHCRVVNINIRVINAEYLSIHLSLSMSYWQHDKLLNLIIDRQTKGVVRQEFIMVPRNQNVISRVYPNIDVYLCWHITLLILFKMGFAHDRRKFV
jgi:hypothetical protein